MNQDRHFAADAHAGAELTDLSRLPDVLDELLPA